LYILEAINILSENSMVAFENPQGFRHFYQKLLQGKEWKISSLSLNHRGYQLQKENFVSYLRNLFNAKGLFRRSVSIAEIISFMDSYYIMDKVFNSLEKLLDPEDFKKLSLYCEYKIKYSKNRRIDYVLRFHDKILIIEFRLSATFPNMSNVWQKKENELLIYKELLSNYFPQECKILVYAFIAMPEFNDHTAIFKHIQYNNQNAKYFAEYINEFLIKNPSLSQIK